MSARDRYHHLVKDALIHEGWNVPNDPLNLTIGGVDFQIDLGAERLLIAERGEEKIAVEIKSFLKLSPTSEFHLAIGQYINYRSALRATDPDRHLFLAVPLKTYETFFQRSFIQQQVQEFHIKLIVYNTEVAEISQWIN